MDVEYLSAREAARRLGTAVTTLYDWLSQSDRGLFRVHGQLITIHYLQTGPHGQGRIRISAQEVARLMELMEVHPRPLKPRRRPISSNIFPGIVVKLGRPS